MKYVVEEIGRGYEFRVAYNLDAIRRVEHGCAKDVCRSADTAILEGYDPMDMVLRIYFKDGGQATFDYDMIDVYTEEDANDAASI